MSWSQRQAIRRRDRTGAGSAPLSIPILQVWSADYTSSRTATKVNYQAIGSGGGIKQIEAKTVDVRRHSDLSRSRTD